MRVHREVCAKEESDVDVAADVQIITSNGNRIVANSSILATASPVFASMLEKLAKRRVRRSSMKVIKIHGIPAEAVAAFVRLISSARLEGEEEEIEEYGLHLLVLSHVYLVAPLKKACEETLAALVNAENVVDLVKLAVLCDAPRLRLRCLQLMAKDFAAVQKTESWIFLQDNDPWLELHILQFLHDADVRKKQNRRKREEQAVYMQLNEVMECLEHICTEGCTQVRPYEKDPPCNNTTKLHCPNDHTCNGIQLLLLHFAKCQSNRVAGGCVRCKRMWQLLRLHSAICEQTKSCKVPLCRQFRLKAKQIGNREEDEKWRILERKVMVAKVMSSLSTLYRTRSLQLKLP